MCKLDKPVVLSEACPDHMDTKLKYIVLNALANVAKWYKGKARIRQLQNVTFPHTILPKDPSKQIFLVDFTTGLRFSMFAKAKPLT